MSDTNETIADIIAEMRFHAQQNIDAEKDKPEYGFLTVEGRSIQSYADRLEAAHKREVGNRAALREAHWVGIKYDSACCSKCGAYIYTGFDTTSQAKDGWGDLYPYCPYCGAQMDLTTPFEGKSRNKKTK